MAKQISTIAITYANSLIEANKDYDKVLADLSTVLDIVNSSADFVLAMKNPTISLDTKFEIIDEILKKEIDEKIINFIKILVEKNRFDEFEQIVQAYSDELDNINNIKRVEVVSAVELSENQKQKTIERLQARLKKDVKVNWLLDTDIIGGLVIKIDDDIIDMSLKNKLDKLSKI